MKETEVHKELVDAAIEEDGFGWKLNNRFIKGVPDVGLQLQDLPFALIEVKMVPGGNRPFYLDLTSHQVRFLRRHQAAGGISGWLVVGKMKKPGLYRMYCGIEFEERQTIDPTEQKYSFMRQPGQTWPVRPIVEHLIRLGRKH